MTDRAAPKIESAEAPGADVATLLVDIAAWETWGESGSQGTTGWWDAAQKLVRRSHALLESLSTRCTALEGYVSNAAGEIIQLQAVNKKLQEVIAEHNKLMREEFGMSDEAIRYMIEEPK